jgi:hypothetical protein
MKVKFTAPFDYTPSLRPQVTYAYRAGWEGTVKRECGAAAVAAGKAVEITDTSPPAPAAEEAVTDAPAEDPQS